MKLSVSYLVWEEASRSNVCDLCHTETHDFIKTLSKHIYREQMTRALIQVTVLPLIWWGIMPDY